MFFFSLINDINCKVSLCCVCFLQTIPVSPAGAPISDRPFTRTSLLGFVGPVSFTLSICLGFLKLYLYCSCKALAHLKWIYIMWKNRLLSLHLFMQGRLYSFCCGTIETKVTIITKNKFLPGPPKALKLKCPWFAATKCFTWTFFESGLNHSGTKIGGWRCHGNHPWMDEWWSFLFIFFLFFFSPWAIDRGQLRGVKWLPEALLPAAWRLASRGHLKRVVGFSVSF